ncbi:MAG: histidine kinase dimerization/phospho-acceptor domain-containing protein [Cyanobacteriota bacterium]|nr:histidine kinase dimerization/phospho-acceptor domain-containing protein [Cyanobacteriota bacterium]
MSLQAVRQLLATGVSGGQADDDAVRRQWWAALATLQDDFLLANDNLRGVWLAAPLPALFDPRLLLQLRGWVWAPAELDALLSPPPALLPSGTAQASGAGAAGHFTRLALADEDGTDPLLLLITPTLQLALAVDGPPGARRLLVRLEPAVLSEALGLIHQRLEHSDPDAALALRAQLQDLGPLHSDDQLALQFWSKLAARLAAMAPSVTLQTVVSSSEPQPPPSSSGELALLEAITHEVRTPLATIRTLIRSLLRRSDLAELVRQRLEQIDGECSEQIDRFGLIFLAAELQRQPASEARGDGQPLARTDLAALIKQMEPLWQRQLSRRGLAFELHLATDLPQVLSDPSRLETMLGGLIDRFSRSLPSGATVQLSLQEAGSRLKLHLRSETADQDDSQASDSAQQRQLVGPVLSWNPTTGSLQLSRQATQQLFEQLGGRLTERSGSGLTVFFPLA